MRRLDVWLYGERIGQLTQGSTRGASFRYDVEWLGRTEWNTPLSLSMPLAPVTYDGDRLLSFLWGLLPDDPAVRRRWALEFQVSPDDPIALLAHVGMDCAGAAQFRPAGHAPVPEGRIEWLDDQEVGDLLGRLAEDSTAWHAGFGSGQFSLAGAQPKIALVFEDGRWGRAWGRFSTTHILKPAIPGFLDQDLNEHLCLTAARSLGLDAIRTSIMRFGEYNALVAHRYDRLRAGGSWYRIHQEDFCQALGVHPDSKYQADGGPDPEAMVGLLRRVQPADMAEASVAAFIDALALNWWLFGTDAHAKNYSLILTGAHVKFAPIYDISSALPYPEVIDHHRAKIAMKIGGEYRIKYIGGREWRRLAADLRLDWPSLMDRILWIGRTLPDAFADAVAGLDAAMARSDLPVALLDHGVGMVGVSSLV